MRRRKLMPLLLATLVVGTMGCATTVNVPLARRTEGLPSANRGQSSTAIFNSRAVANAMVNTPDWVRPEYGRNDGNLAFAQPRALTAVDTWPQATVPTIAAQRRFTINPNPQQIIIFTTPGAGRGFGGGRRGFGGGQGSRFLFSPRPR